MNKTPLKARTILLVSALSYLIAHGADMIGGLIGLSLVTAGELLGFITLVIGIRAIWKEQKQEKLAVK